MRKYNHTLSSWAGKLGVGNWVGGAGEGIGGVQSYTSFLGVEKEWKSGE